MKTEGLYKCDSLCESTKFKVEEDINVCVDECSGFWGYNTNSYMIKCVE